MLRPSGATSSDIHDPSDVSNAIVRSPSSGSSFFSFLSAGSSCFSCARNADPVPRRAHKASRDAVSSLFMKNLRRRRFTRIATIHGTRIYTDHTIHQTRVHADRQKIHGTRIYADHTVHQTRVHADPQFTGRGSTRITR